MKNLKFLFILLLAFPISIFAQSVEGDWKITIPAPEGKTMDALLSIDANGTYTVDLGMDGTVNVEGTYTMDGDKMTIQDTKGEQACLGDATAGVYTITVDDKSFVMTRVNDPCEGRGGPEGVMSFTRQ